ncbi:MAG: 30S ribosomal protein S20 [Firmicutes bacterium]|nr:30S ribosomal protein S20 [Bacillota bacterium]
MPNIKSAIKRVEVARIRTLRNMARKSALKTAIKRFKEAVGGPSPEKTQEAFVKAVSAIDKAAAKGIIHKNTAARKKSRLARLLNAQK